MTNNGMTVYPSTTGGWAGSHRRPVKKIITERTYDELGRCIKEVTTEESYEVWDNGWYYQQPVITYTTTNTSGIQLKDNYGNDSKS